MSDKERMELGEKLKMAREYLGLSQDEVAAHLSIPRTAISLMESGKRGVDLIELKKLAALYQRPISFFANPDEDLNLPKVKDVQMLGRAAEGLSRKDIQEVLKFAEFLKSKSRAKKDSGNG